jgi:CBS-domain-containing membrane protein
MFRRFDIKTELFLVMVPTIVVIAVLLLLQFFSRQQLLFSSLASSAFLIYLDPRHPVNHVRTLLISQIAAAVLGYLVYLLCGPGYLSAALSMIVTIAAMIITRAMHPPAVSTAMIFAFQFTKVNTLVLFLFAVLLLVILIFLQRVSIWIIKRSEGKKVSLDNELAPSPKGDSFNRVN